VALFRKTREPAFASAPIKAAAGASAGVGQFYDYTVGGWQELALTVPTISRARDLMAAMVGALTLKHYTLQWTGQDYEKLYLETETWMDQPDPNVTRNFIMANTFSDMFMYGRAAWLVTSRSSATGRPLTFTWLPQANFATPSQSGPQFFGISNDPQFNGVPLDPNEVITFLAPSQGILYTGKRAITTALKLDQAAERFAVNEIAAGWLQQTDASEPMSAEDLGELAAAWAAARRSNSIGALNSVVTFKEFSQDPSKLQLVEGRQHQSLELARVANIPPYLLGIGVPGYTYQNAMASRQDLYLFGTKPYLDAMEQTLSMNNILPRGRYVEWDLDEYLGEAEAGTSMDNSPSSEYTPSGAPA